MNTRQAAIRRFLVRYFDGQELLDLCFDHFPMVYDDLSPAMRKSRQATLLIDYCRHHNQLDALLRVLEQERPRLYADELATAEGLRSLQADALPPVEESSSPRFFSFSRAGTRTLLQRFWPLLAGAALLAGSIGALFNEREPAFLAAPTPFPTVTPEPLVAALPSRESTPEALPVAASPVAGVVWQRPADDAPMRFVPTGSFAMGSEAGQSDERPAHVVSLSGFWIDETEVTNSRYERCVEADACRPGPYAGDTAFSGSNYPVVGVSWSEAAAYCNWVGGRLPTEAEWEYAARGTASSVYPWGDTFLGEYLNYCDGNCVRAHADGRSDDGYTLTAPVGTYEDGASWVGALDMAGNVWEWVQDRYDRSYYRWSPAENPTGPAAGSGRVLRGGSWGYGESFARAAYRFDVDVTYRNHDVGFRCVFQ